MVIRSRHRSGDASVVSAASFQWDRALLATISHSSMPWDEPLRTTPLSQVADAGARDRLSLLAQFAAHQAFLQFAGIADGEFDPAEWAVVARRGSDVRLVRIASRRADPLTAPIVLSLIRQFAAHVGARLDILRQAWARADAVYAEAFRHLVHDAAADLRWTRASAAGALLAPLAEGLRGIDAAQTGATFDIPSTLDAIRRFATAGASYRLVVLRGTSPLERYSALRELDPDATQDEAAIAERIIARTSEPHHLFVTDRDEAFDDGSRNVITLLSKAHHGTWLVRDAENGLPATKEFLIAPRLSTRSVVQTPPPVFVQSNEFVPYVLDGEVTERRGSLAALAEPARSFIGALALLGRAVPRDAAKEFLAEFLYAGAVEELAIEGVTELQDDELRFVSESVRREAAALIPPASRPAIARVAATYATGVDAALLWMEAGDASKASEVLEQASWPSSEAMMQALQRAPATLLNRGTRIRYANALIDCGRYRDAIELSAGDELVLARAERRMGDYAVALARLERLEQSFEAILLRAEILRLLERETEALSLLADCRPVTFEDQTRCDYEKGLHGAEVALPETHYLAARLQTYRALERSDYAAAATAARISYDRARDVTERIDSALDRLFAVFSAGQWDEARAIAVAALQEVEETQGDRAAGGILFTLAYLAADDGQWAHAAHRIAQLRDFYTSTGDSIRLAELHLLQAHLDFSRGRFADARRAAESIWSGRGHHGQILEAAALILDELDWMSGEETPLRSRGRSGNAELTRRHRRIATRGLEQAASATGSTSERLFAFRRAVATKNDPLAQQLARELDLTLEPASTPMEVELRILRAAATREFPFAEHDFDVPWCHATRNRLGHWSTIGPVTPRAESLDARDAGGDWIVSSDRERLYLAGSSTWSSEARQSIAALFHLRSENQRLRRLVGQDEMPQRTRTAAIDGIVGHSAAIREVASLVARVADRDVAICILGESGTGKELIARAIHRQSGRRRKQFTAVNCAALPDQLVESELFGHIRGAFTGADRDRAGLIETTDGGTLFLDEIGELPLPAQAKLLRFLQEGEFRRVGDVVNRNADVRIVSATNRQLDVAVEEGRFRDDLYYRVRGVELVLPPLRDRGADVLLLAEHFLAGERERHRSGPSALSPEVEAIFTAYSWPGNVRELQNTIRAAHAMAGDAGSIEMEHLPERLRKVAPSRVAAGSYQHAVARFKRDLIERSLVEAEGNQNRAAALLRMSRQALAYQIRELGILVRSASGN